MAQNEVSELVSQLQVQADLATNRSGNTTAIAAKHGIVRVLRQWLSR